MPLSRPQLGTATGYRRPAAASVLRLRSRCHHSLVGRDYAAAGLLVASSPAACHRRHASTGCMGRKAGPQTHDHDCQILADLQNFFTGSFLDKFLKTVNIWQSCKQERMVVSCTLRAWPTYSVLLKDEESARDNHVFAGNFAKYSPIKFFHSQTRQ